MKLRSASLLGPALALFLSGAAIAANVPASLKGHALAGEARIGLGKARAIALKARPGSITDQELEKEGGGLRYSFDIRSAGRTYEVGVDANTGAVLENGRESGAAERAESH